MNRTFAEAVAPRSVPTGELIARAIAGVIVRREIANDPKMRVLRGLALESAVAEATDEMWLHLVDEADAVIAALNAGKVRLDG